MKTAITGTPGTGKTAAASYLKAKGYSVLHFSDIAAPFICGYDQDRHCDIVDVAALDETFRQRTGDLMVEGHLSHRLSVDQAVVLRCHPDELRQRLRHKGWTSRKVEENLEAEALDIILTDSLEQHGEDRVAQIDTTNRTVAETADAIAETHCYGVAAGVSEHVDWSGWVRQHAG